MFLNQFSLFIVKISKINLLLYSLGHFLSFELMSIVFTQILQVIDEIGACFLHIQDRIWSTFASCIYTSSPYEPQDLFFHPWTAICNYFLPFKHHCSSMVRVYLTSVKLVRILLVDSYTHATFRYVAESLHSFFSHKHEPHFISFT